MDYCKETYNMLSSTSLQWATLVLTLITTILWGVYVIYTKSTFEQIKKQTDLQSRAYLIIQSRLIESKDRVSNERILGAPANLHNKWKTILANNLPSTAIGPETMIELTLINRGNSDVRKFKIDLKLEINASKYLEETTNNKGEFLEWTIESNSTDLIRRQDEIKLVVLKVGYYPSAILSGKVSYEDLNQNKDCARLDEPVRVINRIAFDYVGIGENNVNQGIHRQKILLIQSAKYVSGENWIDVTSRIRDLIVNNKLNFSVSNELLGGEPGHGKEKILYIDFVLGGIEQQLQFQERSLVQIG